MSAQRQSGFDVVCASLALELAGLDWLGKWCLHKQKLTFTWKWRATHENSKWSCDKMGKVSKKYTANLGTKILEFRGFDKSRIFNVRGGILMSIGNLLEIVSQRILVGIVLSSRKIGYKPVDSHSERLARLRVSSVRHVCAAAAAAIGVGILPWLYLENCDYIDGAIRRVGKIMQWRYISQRNTNMKNDYT